MIYFGENPNGPYWAFSTFPSTLSFHWNQIRASACFHARGAVNRHPRQGEWLRRHCPRMACGRVPPERVSFPEHPTPCRLPCAQHPAAVHATYRSSCTLFRVHHLGYVAKRRRSQGKRIWVQIACPSLPRRRESRACPGLDPGFFRGQWIPACAGMTLWKLGCRHMRLPCRRSVRRGRERRVGTGAPPG